MLESLMTLAALLPTPVPPLAERHIDQLSDAQICDTLHELATRPSMQIEDFGPIDFQEWEVDCDAKLLRMPTRILDERLTESLLSDYFQQPEFCTADNLQQFWRRGWRLEMRFRWIDGRVADVRACG